MPRYREWDLTCKVYVGNLDQRATKHQIEDIFSKYGPLRNVWVARNPPGFAFVEYEDNRDAEDAVRNLDGSRACGSRIRVEMSNGRTRHDGRRGGGDRGDRRREERGGQRTRYRSRSRDRSRERDRSRSPKRSPRRSRRSRSEESRSVSRDRR
ncbi:RNA-binding protein 1-like isoform X2 [Chironomus tepperi]|uniref:RNA-binding protein 1-like isoform X2 n=1 Tax=Chironomus tepperi TaxID=113505 RepID=UPI00391FC989